MEGTQNQLGAAIRIALTSVGVPRSTWWRFTFLLAWSDGSSLGSP